ncbi:hypothetical protein C8R44DRAFT_54020 [Mycena epipterygia]|nr:hypothetical protein C8R44DRAFT_54020 [Mycena epipterygia]
MSSVLSVPASTARTPTLPNDIVDHLLVASPNFDALHASVGVSRAWREVYEAHPTSIALAVARNMVGEALPQAVRFMRYPYPRKDDNCWDRSAYDYPEDYSEDEEGDSDSEDDSEDDEEDEEDEDGGGARGKRKRQTTKAPKKHQPPTLSESAEIGDLGPKERIKLQENAAIVHQLEEIFSFRHKDKNHKTSQLMPLESARFSRAMYRVMIYCKLFYHPLMIDDTDALVSDPDEVAAIQRGRQAMLNEYPTPELLEIRTVVDFLLDLIYDVDKSLRLLDICLSTGPAVILKAYLVKSMDIFDDVLMPEVIMCGAAHDPFWGGFVSIPLDRVLEERKVVSPESEWDAILDMWYQDFGGEDASEQEDGSSDTDDAELGEEGESIKRVEVCE